MFKAKKDKNVELFTPLLPESERSDMIDHQFTDRHEKIDMEFIGKNPNTAGENLHGYTPSSSKTNTSEKLSSLIEERKRMAIERKKNKIFALDVEDASKRPEDCKFYIISIIVPLIVFVFLLIFLFAFIVSPVLQGINAINEKNSGESNHPEHHDGHHQPDSSVLNPPDLSSVAVTQKIPGNAVNMSSSVKKDGDRDPIAHHDHHHDNAN